ncbi:MAG: CHAD domain-containing protein [Mucilaginibacter sp.]
MFKLSVVAGASQLYAMKKREEENYFDKQWLAMTTSLAAYLETENPEDLHRFRVQVKKLRAFIVLADSVEGASLLGPLFKPVKSVFKKAGEIRNAYMNQQLGKAHHTGNNLLMESQQLLEVNASRDFKLAGSKHLDKIKQTQHLIEGKIQPISNLHINLFYQKLLQQVAVTVKNIKFNEGLHDCRKLVKILIYNLKLVRPVLTIAFNDDYMDQVQTAIGDWHDNVLAIALFSSGGDSDKAIVVALKKQQAALKRNITALTKDFYNQATTVVELPIEQLS